MTVHGAKGAEFRAVHLPAVARHYVPLARRRPDCPPPPDLARLAMSPDDHDAEEKALFFVALSRAKDHLTISHARRYTPGREAGPSAYVAQIGPAETTAHADAPNPAPAAGLAPQPSRAAYPERDLQVYMTCPARYRFEVIDGLRAVTTPSHYRRFRRAATSALRELERSAMTVGEAPHDTLALAALDAAWAVEGPVGSQLESYHRARAEETILRMAGVLRAEEGARYPREEWVVDVGAGRVSFWPDRVVEQPWDVVVQTMRSIGNGRSEGIRGIHALMLEGAHRRFPGERVVVQTLDPETGETMDVDMTMADDALEPYRAVIRGIERGELTPRPDLRSCPSCRSTSPAAPDDAAPFAGIRCEGRCVRAETCRCMACFAPRVGRGPHIDADEYVDWVGFVVARDGPIVAGDANPCYECLGDAVPGRPTTFGHGGEGGRRARPESARPRPGHDPGTVPAEARHATGSG